MCYLQHTKRWCYFRYGHQTFRPICDVTSCLPMRIPHHRTGETFGVHNDTNKTCLLTEKSVVINSLKCLGVLNQKIIGSENLQNFPA